MVLKNLFRRKIRTLLTMLGVSIGVAAIISLGALADGLQSGYSSMMAGSKADLVLSQPNAFDVSFSAVDEKIEPELLAMPEVAEASAMLQGWAQAEGEPFFFVFGYPQESFVLSRFQIIQGGDLHSHEAQTSRGKPILLGSAAAEVLDKAPGDTLRIGASIFRVIGIYQTGDAYEDSGGLLRLKDAQDTLGRPRQVSLYYIRLKDPALRERFTVRAERQWKDYAVSGTDEFDDKQQMTEILRAFVWAIGGLAIVIGGVGMMNAQLMSVFERTREIGVLRAVGWSRLRVMWMILAESLLVCVLGGLLGAGVGWLGLVALSTKTVFMGITTTNLRPELLGQAFGVVLVLGLLGGLYPAWRASRLPPVEALRYEGGGGGTVHRFPLGGMAVQSLWQRSARTLLTLGTIGITVGAIMSLEGLLRGFTDSFSGAWMGQAEVLIRQADVSDTSLSAVDERSIQKIAAMPEVAGVSGMVFTAVSIPETGGFFILQGYAPSSFSMQRFKIVEGKPLSGNRQIIIGGLIADSMKKGPGDTLELGGTRYRIVGVYETGVGWEETGGVITLRDAQVFAGRPHKVTMASVKLRDPAQADAVVEKINDQFPVAYAALSGEFVEQMPDMQSSDAMLNAISFLAILVGGVGVLNTMLMSVFERTREIGVLRALGWRRRAVLGLILKEAVLLGILGGLAGVGIAMGLVALIGLAPLYGALITPVWAWDVFARAILVALLLGLIGGLYPAFRATRLQPVEALRYE